MGFVSCLPDCMTSEMRLLLSYLWTCCSNECEAVELEEQETGSHSIPARDVA